MCVEARRRNSRSRVTRGRRTKRHRLGHLTSCMRPQRKKQLIKRRRKNSDAHDRATLENEEMAYGNGIALVIFLLLASGPVAAETGSGSGSGTSKASVHDCTGVKLTCSAWAAKDKNTCRTCQQAQCKTENGKDVLAGNKTQTQCYEGHGAPPPDKN